MLFAARGAFLRAGAWELGYLGDRGLGGAVRPAAGRSLARFCRDDSKGSRATTATEYLPSPRRRVRGGNGGAKLRESSGGLDGCAAAAR